MAALSLTEIRDAFVDEESAGGFGADATPMQHLPHHAKQSDAVNPRMAEENEARRRRRDRRSHRLAQTASRERSETTSPPSKPASSELMRLTTNALVLTSGLAIHFAVSRGITQYFERSYLTPTNQLIVAAIYPVAVLLIIWHIRSWNSGGGGGSHAFAGAS